MYVGVGPPPPPPARQVGQPQPKPPSRHGDQGGGGGGWANGLPCHPPPAKQFSSRPVGASGGTTDMFWFAPKGPHPLRDTRGMGHGLQSEEMMCTDDWKCCVARGGGESLEPAGPSQTTYAACGKGPFHMLSYIRLLLVHISDFLRCWPAVSSSTAHPCNEESGLQTPVVIIIVWTSRRWRKQEMEGPDA